LVLTSDELEILRSVSSSTLGSVERNVLRRLSREVAGYDLIFIFAGLGGELGSHIVPGLANLCRHHGGLVIASATMPVSAEGPGRRSTAVAMLPRLINAAHLTITYPNDGLLKVAPNLPFRRTFRVMDEIMMAPPRELVDVLTNDDIRRLRDDLSSVRHMRMGAGAGRGMQREEVAVSESFSSPWFDFNLDECRMALVVMSGKEVDEYSQRDILDNIQARVPNAKIWYGVRSDHRSDDLRVTVLLDAKV